MRSSTVALVATMFFALISLLAPDSLSAAEVRVTDPGLVLIVDGMDHGASDTTFNVDATFPVTRYEFGFVDAGSFTPIALNPNGPASLYGTYQFAGGTLVDFALRDTTDARVYRMADPLDYADQIYSNPIDPSHSVTPVVSSTYYNTLVLEWDLDRNGFDALMDPGFTLTQALDPYDGMMAVPNPVPIPASLLLFGSGLVGLAGLRHRRSSVIP